MNWCLYTVLCVICMQEKLRIDCSEMSIVILRGRTVGAFDFLLCVSCYQSVIFYNKYAFPLLLEKTALAE